MFETKRIKYTFEKMEKAINNFCPRSGKTVSSNALTKYRGFTVGFCNPACRDDFAKNIQENPTDSFYFDIVIKENMLSQPKTAGYNTTSP